MSEKISCPKCEEHVEKAGFPGWVIVVAILFFPLGLLAFLAGKNPTKCPHCGFSWQV